MEKTYTLRSNTGLELTCSSWGATLRSLEVPVKLVTRLLTPRPLRTTMVSPLRNGVQDVVLGYGDPEGMQYLVLTCV